MCRKHKIMYTVAAALIAFTVLKMFAIVGSQPLIAYANNYDFIRVEGCLGLWQDYTDGTPQASGHINSPVNRLLLNRQYKIDLCLVSVDNIYPYLATRFRTIGSLIDFRIIGGLKAAAVVMAMVIILWLSADAWVVLIVSIIFSMLFGDFAYLIYFNTLYNEFSELFGLFICIISLWLLWTGRTRSLIGVSITMGIGILFLGLSKEQYIWFAVLLAVAAATIYARKYYYRTATLLVLIGITCPLLFKGMNPSDYGVTQAIQRANITDTVLGAVLPHATDPDAALHMLHLPASCESAIGKNWYSKEFMEEHLCPEVFETSRAYLVPLFIQQPATFFVPMSKAIHHARPIMDPVYGIFEDMQSANRLRTRVTRATSLTTVLMMLSDRVFYWLMIVAMCSGIVAMLMCGRVLWLRQRDTSGAGMLVAMGGIIIIYALGSAVFGDGLADIPKHAAPWPFGLGLVFLGLCVFVMRFFIKIVSKKNIISPSFQS
ncbi:MAG: hypothetical protein LBQ20_10685 [Rhodanobacter sp.]|jgi:hypothetical protein|nr:hypothetical protein [Rhodanobacter sp.]